MNVKLLYSKAWNRPLMWLAVFFLLEGVLYICVDRPLALTMKELDTTHPDMVNFFRHITDLGKSIWYLPAFGLITLFCAFLSRGKDVPPAYRRFFCYVGLRTLFLFSTIAISGIIADIVKPILGRARPILFLRDQIYGFSPFTLQGSLWNGMPSGHSTTVFALACSLVLLFPRGRFVWLSYAIILGSSRVIVDAHFLSDVCAGAALGYVTSQLVYKYGMERLARVIFPLAGRAV